MRITIITSSIAIILSSMSIGALADNVSAGSKATASLVASCQIQAQSISFGALVLPISAQSANSNMSVLCSKEAPYKIDLTYGLSTNYWTFSPWGGTWDSSKQYSEMKEYDSSGKLLRTELYRSPKWIPTSTLIAAVGCTVTSDGKCYSKSGSGTAGVGNMYGAKGDHVAYNIYLPEDSSKIWNIGQNAYTATGTGVSQNIPLKATLLPSGSTAFPTPDMYTDTVTATITY